ncbi:MAG: hypothetical protein ACRDOH_23190 [Streptosporangiaceae bacterium]
MGTCAQTAQAANWQDAVIHVYGQDTTVQIAVADALWHGSFKNVPGRVVLVKEPGSGKAYDLGIFTLDTDAVPAAIAERHSWRWPIEPSNATGKQFVGVGDACNRVQKAVERTVPFGFKSAWMPGPGTAPPRNSETRGAWRVPRLLARWCPAWR